MKSIIRYIVPQLLLLTLSPAFSSETVHCQPVDIQLNLPTTKVLLLGEVHGTVEMPQFAGDVLCSFATQGRQVILAVEIPSSEQPAIARFLSSAGSESDVMELTAGAHWHRRSQDGRSSKAMFRLLDRVRRMRLEGIAVNVRAIDGMNPGSTRDKVMADNIRSLITGGPDQIIVALVGSVHASKSVGLDYNPSFEPMAYLLRDVGVTSVALQDEGGTAWVCTGQTQNTMHCDETVRPATSTEGDDPHVETRYDAFKDVGRITASEPQVHSLP